MLDRLERAAACETDELKQILETQALNDAEHAVKLIDWLRRNAPAFDHHFKRILGSSDDLRPRRPGELSDAAGAELMQQARSTPITIL